MKAIALLIACGLAMVGALVAIFAATSGSSPVWQEASRASKSSASAPAEPEAFRFREDVTALEAEEINAAMPVSREPILPAKSFAILSPSATAGSQLSAVDCMTAAIYYEAASETVTGQRAVAQVILNRMRHPAYPNSVCGVVFQGSQRVTGCQFTFTCDGSLGRRPSAGGWLRARAVAVAALSGYVEPSVGHATHYHAVYVVPYWSSSLTKLATVGSHIFYRWSGSNGLPRAFASHYAGAETSPLAAAASLSGYLLAGTGLSRPLDLSGDPVEGLAQTATVLPPSSGLKAPLGGALSSDPRGALVADNGSLAVLEHQLKGEDARPQLIDSRPRLID